MTRGTGAAMHMFSEHDLAGVMRDALEEEDVTVVTTDLKLSENAGFVVETSDGDHFLVTVTRVEEAA